MKKKVWISVGVVLAILLIAVTLFSQSYRKITVISGEQHVDQCPRFARPGQEVTVTTAVVCDAEIYVNGVDGKYVQPGVYVFTMPDEDVELKVTVISFRGGS